MGDPYFDRQEAEGAGGIRLCVLLRRTSCFALINDGIAVTVVSPRMGSDGWPFANVDSFPGADEDPLNGASHVKDIYYKVQPNYDGRFTVPILWDKQKQTIVNNESSEIIRMFNTEFNYLLPKDKAELDLYPEAHRKEIDEINDWVYDTVNSTSTVLLFGPVPNKALFRRRIQVRFCYNPASVRSGSSPSFQLS